MSDPATPAASPAMKTPIRPESPAELVDRAWEALRRAPEDWWSKVDLGNLLRRYPDLATAEMAPAIGLLVRDPAIDPRHLSRAGWQAWRKMRGDAAAPATDEDWEALVDRLEHDETALALLEESQVEDRAAEQFLTRVRRWLALSARWKKHPRLIDALGRQAALNGGAWPFDDEERAATAGGRLLARTYLPAGGNAEGSAATNDFADDVTNAVARQYEQWPYPAWTRIGRPPTTALAALRSSLHAGAASEGLGPARILVAGCGTGAEAANFALTFPGVAVTAIDLSAASLDYGRRRCAAAGIPPIRFEQLDLCSVAELGENYDVISCCGVLHHLAEPEAGWAALAGVLKPGGLMRVMVYSRLGRLSVIAARQLLRAFNLQAADDDEVRKIRAWLMERNQIAVVRRITESLDFSSLAGTRDLLCHPHEDPFDVPRIERTMRRLGLRLVRVDLSTPVAERLYAKWAPEDPHRRDFRAWGRLEFEKPELFGSRYDFWCGKPVEAAGPA